MIEIGLLWKVITAEVLAFCVAVVLILGHGLALIAREKRYKRLVHRGRNILAAALEGHVGEEAVEDLARMPVDVQLRLFSEVAPILLGSDRKRLGRLGERVGLAAAADEHALDKRWWRRLRALRVLTLIDADSKVAPLLLKDRVADVAAQAAEWASEHPSPEVIDELVRMLSHERVLCRHAVKDALLRIGRPSIAPLAHALETWGDGTLAALQVAARLGDPSFLQGTLRLSRSEDDEIRTAAAATLGGLAGRSAADRLVEMLEDPSPGVRAATATALGHMGHWPAAPALANAMVDPAWEVRRSAGLALARLGAPGSLMLRKVTRGGDGYAADMARHVLDLSGRSETAVVS